MKVQFYILVLIVIGLAFGSNSLLIVAFKILISVSGPVGCMHNSHVTSDEAVSLQNSI